MTVNIKYIKELIVFLLLIFSINTSSKAQETWDLKKCTETAKEKNYELKTLKSEIDKSHINYTKAKQNVYPELEANFKSGNYYGLLKDPETDIFSYGSTYVNNFQLASGFNVFSGFYNRYQKSHREGQINTTTYLYDKKLNEIILEITYYYYQVLYAKENITLVKKRIEILQQKKKIVEANVNAEVVNKRELFNNNSQISKAETELLMTENAVKQNIANLTSLLGLSHRDSLSLAGSADISAMILQLYDYNTVIEKAKSAFPEIKIGTTEIKNAEFAFKTANSFRYPVLKLEGGVNIITQNTINSFSKNLYKKNYQYVGLNLNIPIYKNYNIKQDVALAAVDIEMAKNNAEKLSIELENNVYKAVMDYNNAYNLYYSSLLKQQLAINEEYNYAKRLYEVGNMGIFEFTDITERLNAFDTELLKAKYDLIFKLKVVEFYSGEVTF